MSSRKGVSFGEIMKILLVLLIFVGLVTTTILLKDKIFSSIFKTQNSTAGALEQATTDFNQIIITKMKKNIFK